MNVYGWFLVILVTALAVILGFAWLLGRGLAAYDRIMLLDRVQDLDQLSQDGAWYLPGLPRAGRFEVEYLPGPPFADPTYGGKVHDIHGGPGENCWCGYIGHNPGASYGPFPADTGPLIIMSESMAAVAAHEREVRAMIEAAERKIGPVRLWIQNSMLMSACASIRRPCMTMASAAPIPGVTALLAGPGSSYETCGPPPGRCPFSAAPPPRGHGGGPHRTGGLMSTDAKYRQGWADGKAERDPDSRELAYGSDRLNAYERGYIDSGYFETPCEGAR